MLIDLQLSTGVLIAAGAAGAGLATTAVIFGTRKLIEVGQFSYHNARLSTAGNPYVRKEELQSLLDMDDPSIVSQTINSDLKTGNDPSSFREVDRSLMTSFHGILTDLSKNSPAAVKPFIKAYTAKFEVEELKRLLRLISLRSEPLFPVGWLTEDVERHILNSKDIKGALEVLEGQPVTDVISKNLKKEGVSDLGMTDMMLERYYLDELARTSTRGYSARRGISALNQILTDRYNIHTILRSRSMGSSREEVLSMIGGRTGTISLRILEQMIESSGTKEALSALNGTHLEPFFKDVDENSMTDIETRLDTMILEGSVGLSHSFGTNIGPTIRYLVSKEMELRNIRTIFQGKYSNWSNERTRKMMVTEGDIQ